ncbi:MAG: Arm DNA-binding domain-containing protein [Bacteroidota bacterium]|nr:Arm DNA-binding domain-containing protein [Bacteroidota bacterium]
MPIYLRITVNGKGSETTTGWECEPSLWNSIAGRLKGTKEDTKSSTAYLNTLQKQVYV